MVAFKSDINKKIYAMIIPITIENILQMTAGLVSMGLVGRIDAIAISALGISLRLVQLVWAIYKGIATGAMIFVAHSLGANNHKKMVNVIRQGLLSIVILGCLLHLAIFILTPQLLSVFGPKPELLRAAVSYMKIASWGLPFLAIVVVVGGIFQGMGNAKLPMRVTFIMNIINIIVGYLLIFGKLGFPPLGIRGAAIAAVVSQGIAACIDLYILFNKNGLLHSYLNKKILAIDIKQVLEIYRVGIPTSLESAFWQIAAVILTRAMLTFGETAFAAYQLGLQAESISYMPGMGFGIAATAFVGQALGSRDKSLAKRYLKEIYKGGMLITSISVIILVFFPKTMMSLLTNKEELINLGAIYLILMGLVQFPQNTTSIIVGAMRGAGYTKMPMIIAGIGLWGIRVPFTLIATYLLKLSIIAIWVIIAIDMLFRFIVVLIMYKYKNIYESKVTVEQNSR